MKRAWSGLLLGIGTLPVLAATCETPSVQGELKGNLMPAAKSALCFRPWAKIMSLPR
jgi:enterochelin esterase family protein